MAPTYETVDDYVASVPDDVRTILQRIRVLATGVLPGSVEAIRYGIPTLTVDGRSVVHFAAWAHHISVYPVPSGDAALTGDLAPYATGKGTLRFSLDQPIPYELVERVVRQLGVERTPA